MVNFLQLAKEEGERSERRICVAGKFHRKAKDGQREIDEKESPAFKDRCCRNFSGNICVDTRNRTPDSSLCYRALYSYSTTVATNLSKFFEIIDPKVNNVAYSEAAYAMAVLEE